MNQFQRVVWTRWGEILHVVQKTSSLLWLHCMLNVQKIKPKRTEIVIFEFHAWCYWLHRYLQFLMRRGFMLMILLQEFSAGNKNINKGADQWSERWVFLSLLVIDILSWAPSLKAISINQRGGCLVGGCCVNDSRVQMGELNALGPPTHDPHW